MHSRKLLLTKTNWHRKLANMVFKKKEGFIVLDINEGLVRTIKEIYLSNEVYTFMDKSIYVIIAKFLSKEVSLIEEGIGLYYAPKKTRSIIAQFKNLLMSIINLVLNFKLDSFNYEQGRTSLYNKLYCRNKSALPRNLERLKVYEFDNYFFRDDYTLNNQEDFIFWGCDYLALDCLEEEIKAVLAFDTEFSGNIIYKVHPRIANKIDKRLKAFTDINETQYFLNYVKHATLASGSVTAELFDKHDIYIRIDREVEMSNTIRKFYNIEGSSNLTIIKVFNNCNLKLSDIL